MDPSSVIGVLWDATKCLCGCARAKQEADFISDLEPNLRLLDDKWKKLEVVKKDVEAEIEAAENTREMQRSYELNHWLQQAEQIQQEIKDIQVHGAQEIQKKCPSKCCPKNCKSSYKLGKKVAKMLQNVDELAAQGTGFCKDSRIAHKVPPKAIEMPPYETVGLDLMFERVWNSIEDQNVGVIGLHGMGGVGKTTLLKRINNEIGKRMLEFNVVMWVVVSKETNRDSIMDNIRKLVGIGDNIWNLCSSQNEKATKIYEVLEEKKFVLLLDDIWEEVDLKLVGVPNPKDTNFQSKVLFTTRREDICAKMQAQRTFKVNILKKNEALELFRRKVGEETLKSHPDIPKVADEMAEECDGLPLALIVVGSAMAGVKSVEAWEHSKNNLLSSSWTALDLESKVFSILKFSYDRLPDAVHKNCFLYCALYPEDYKIGVLDLIDKWIGEGFLCRDMANSVRDMSGYGEFILEKLKLSCLLENVEDDIFMERTIKIHDMIRDMALWIARDQDENKKKLLVQGDTFEMPQDDIESWKLVERISIRNYDGSNVPIPPCPNLRTFLLECKSMEGLHNIRYSSSLKVLELQVHERLNILVGIGYLMLLEYLSLVGRTCPYEFISMELKKLRNLKYFSLKIIDDDVPSIPLGVISSLQQLRVLRLNTQRMCDVHCKQGKKFLEEVESLPKFEELRIDINTENDLDKLIESAKLQSYIYALDLSDIDIQLPLLLTSMSKMMQLRQLGLFGLRGVEDSSVSYTCCLTMLRHVTIRKCYSFSHVTWLKHAPLLQQLVIDSCSMVEVIKEEGSEDERGTENIDSIFSSLVTLDLRLVPYLKSIHRTTLSFPSLKSINVYRCHNLKKLPLGSNSAKHTLTHIKGNPHWWNNLEWDDPAAKDKFQSKFQS